MYQHLDDPTPPVADAARYRAVRARADALRARGRHRRTSAVLAGLLVVALAAVGWLAADGGPGARSQVTAFQFNEQADPLPAGTVVPAVVLTSVVFVNGRDGFGLADHRSRPVLAATTDGGATWHLVGGRLPHGLSGTAGSTEVQFTGTRVGYLWTAPVPGAVHASLWRTTDGGTSWRRARTGGPVFDVSAIGANVWALTGSCGPGVAGCRLALEVSDDAGRTWHRAPALPPVGGWASTARPAVELARVTPSEAYAYVDVAGTQSLVLTTDTGATWATRAVPCAAPIDAGSELALSGTDDLWLVCGGQAAGGVQAKALYRSSTGGSSWSLVAQTSAFAGSGVPPPGVGSLPLDGYVAPYSLGHRNLAVLSPAAAWLFPTGGAVSATTDGGSTWSPVANLAGAAFGSGAPGDVTFISGDVGWVVELGVGLWHTTDAVTWRPVGT